MKKLLTSLAKWTWFGLLVLVAFGYMASGLSQPNENGARSGNGLVSAAKQDSQQQKLRADSETTPASLSRLDSSVDPDNSNPSRFERKPRDPSLLAAIEAVNLARSKTLDQLDLQSAPAADWLTQCRRISLALVGNGLSLQEIRSLEQMPESQRTDAHLQNLLRDPRFHHYWSERWTRFLVGADEGPFIVYRRRRFRHWLSEMLASNQPYDKIVRELITAEGLWTDKPQVNFLTVTFDSNDGKPDPVRLAARTSRAFLGLRIDCLQCHDDFLGNVSLGDLENTREGLQTDFHGLASFFTSAKMNGIQGIRTSEPDYEYKFLDETEEVAVPATVPYAEELLPEKGDARTRLATWITHPKNTQFSRAAVTRFWALMFGKSPTEAVDNLPLDEPLPEVLQPLVEDFIQHRDIRRTIEIIVRSDAFTADSRADFEITNSHETHHAVFPLTRLRAEQMAASISQASRIKSINRESAWLVQLIRFGNLTDFLRRYGDLGENEFTEEGITIPQKLMMLNGNMLREAGELNPLLNTSSHINMFAQDDVMAVDTAYLCLLNRLPSDAERDYFVSSLAEADERGKAVEDLFWTLANSTEFAWNH